MLTFLGVLVVLVVLFYAIKFVITAMTPLVALVIAGIVVYLAITIAILRR